MRDFITSSAITVMQMLDAYNHHCGGTPECVQVEADATGYMGGDSSHGGKAFVAFTDDGCGDNVIEIEVSPEMILDAFHDAETLPDGRLRLCLRQAYKDPPIRTTIRVGGDWEQSGLMAALRKAWLRLAPLLERAELPRVYEP